MKHDPCPLIQQARLLADNMREQLEALDRELVSVNKGELKSRMFVCTDRLALQLDQLLEQLAPINRNRVIGVYKRGR